MKVTVTKENAMSRQFQAALRKLIDDDRYRAQVKNDPLRIADDFQFTDAERSMLVAIGETAKDDSAPGPRLTVAMSSSCSGGGPR